MAITQEQRDIALESNKILESYIDKESTTMISEDLKTPKMVDLQEIEKFIEGKKLSYYGMSRYPGDTADVSIGIYFLSNKNVTVDSDNAFLNTTFSYRFDDRYGNRLNVESKNVKGSKLTDFLEMAKANKEEDAISAKGITKLCDSSQIYSIYKDEALAIMRKTFSHPYFMFTGPSIYHVEMKKPGMTLYVQYDKIRKKFKYAYNPDFILECAIDEWSLQKNRYKSLSDCYTYILAFMITHEMLHIIHHNTMEDFGDQVSAGNHRVNNQVQDSFINCKIARRYLNAPGINRSSTNGIAPVPRLGVGSRITVRGEHNVGLREFNVVKTMQETMVKVLSNTVKVEDLVVNYSNYSGLDVHELAGADIFISIDVSPVFSKIRKASSNQFQRFINDMIGALTEGKVYSKNSQVSDAEKLSDLDVLPEGTMVMVKGTHAICYTGEHNEEDNTYQLFKSNVKGIKKIPMGDGSFLCVTEYEPTTVPFGVKHRIKIKPYNPMDDAFMEEDKPKQTKLTPEDLQKVKGEQAPKPQMPQQPQGDQGGQMPNVKSLNVGDVVWIRRLKKFGRITAITNGKFQIEEVIERPAKVIDDSDNY